MYKGRACVCLTQLRQYTRLLRTMQFDGPQPNVQTRRGARAIILTAFIGT